MIKRTFRSAGEQKLKSLKLRYNQLERCSLVFGPKLQRKLPAPLYFFCQNLDKKIIFGCLNNNVTTKAKSILTKRTWPLVSFSLKDWCLVLANEIEELRTKLGIFFPLHLRATSTSVAEHRNRAIGPRPTMVRIFIFCPKILKYLIPTMLKKVKIFFLV